MLRLSNFGPHARMLGMVILWGASWPAGRIVAQAMPPLAAASLRFVLALLVLLPWMYHSGGFTTATFVTGNGDDTGLYIRHNNSKFDKFLIETATIMD